MQIAIAALLVVVGLLNLAPVIGIVSVARVQALYDVPIEHGDLGILMRHRALLFGLLGLLIIVSAWHVPLRPAAIVAGLVSMVGFVAIAMASGPYGGAIRNVVIADVVGAGLLVLVVILAMLSPSG